MPYFFYIGAHAVLAAIVLIPVFYLWNKSLHCPKQSILYCLMAIYFSVMYAVTGLPTIGHIRFDPHINLEPFAYMFSDYRSSILNVILFLPLGAMLPVLWSRFRNALQTLLFGLLVSLGIEVLQLFTYRATDINDLMTNTFGTLIGWCVGMILLRFMQIPGDPSRKMDVYRILGIAFGIMFFLQPIVEKIFQ